MKYAIPFCLIGSLYLLLASDPGTGDWPMWGGTADRNMVSNAKGLPTDWDVKSKKNKGLEGVSYDAESDTLFAVREDKPPAVYRIHPLLAKGHAKISEWSLDLDGLDDLSDTFFDTSTGWYGCSVMNRKWRRLLTQMECA